MIDLLERFANAIDGMAGLNGYPLQARHRAWTERLTVNLPELSLFEALRPVGEAGYLSPPAATVEPGGTPVGEDAPGIAAIARAAHAAPLGSRGRKVVAEKGKSRGQGPT